MIQTLHLAPLTTATPDYSMINFQRGPVRHKMNFEMATHMEDMGDCKIDEHYYHAVSDPIG